MHTRFFPLNRREDILIRQAHIAQEFHLPCEDMLVSTFIYLSDKVAAIWEAKKKCIENGTIYIGG